MDPTRFDRLTRAIGSGTSRRGLLKTLAGGALAAFAGQGAAEAAAKRSVGNSCRSNSDCASNLCVQESRARKICHCRSEADCPAAHGACQSAACLPSGYCGAAAATGAACDPGDACVTGAVCQADGSCLGTPKHCDDNNACTSDSCDPATGNCVNTPIVCDDGNACTIDSCDQVTGCVFTPLVCPPPDACHHDSPGCDAATGDCPIGPLMAGWCFIDGVCHFRGDTDHGNACVICDPDVSTSAFTTFSDGSPCDDGNPCTGQGACQSGVCQAGAPEACLSRGACYVAGACDPVNGCVYTESAPGTPCNDVDENCASGSCCPAAQSCGAPPNVTCCAAGQSCAGGQCCDAANLCGSAPNLTCCAAGTHCAGGVCVINTGGGGCFAAGARVTLADGATKPIEAIQVGDLLRGRGGAVNAVLAIQTPELGGRALHSLNGGAHFVTAAQPFWTAAGVKSIDPEATVHEAGRTVGRLTVGDLMLGGWDARNGAEPGRDGHAPVPLESIAAEAFDWGTRLYNLIVSGDGSHLVGGLLTETKIF